MQGTRGFKSNTEETAGILTNGQAGGTIDAIAVAKSDGNVIYFSEYNEIYVTQDNGQNWLTLIIISNRSISIFRLTQTMLARYGFIFGIW